MPPQRRAGLDPGLPSVSWFQQSRLQDTQSARSIIPDEFSGTRPARRRTGAGRDQECDPRQAPACDRQGCRHGDPARLVQGGRAGLRDRIVHHWLTAEKQSYDAGAKRVYYLSLEFLIGRLFTDALNNMGLLPVFETALGDLGVGLADLRKCEPDAALGNGGLGRLAACFMGRMAA